MIKNIHRTPLFAHLQIAKLEGILSHIPIITKTYQKGELVDGSMDMAHAIGFLIKGRLYAMKYLINGQTMHLKTMEPGEVFGLGSIFQTHHHALTYMEVMQPTVIVYIKEADLFQLLQSEPTILKQYLTLVSRKIDYLNGKIQLISHPLAEDRLKLYLYDLWREQGQNLKINLPMGKSQLAIYLNMSRGTLYRILHVFETKGYLQVDKQNIHLKSEQMGLFFS